MANFLDRLIPQDWKQILSAEFDQDYWRNLNLFLEEEMKSQTVFPPEEEIFSAFKFTPYDKVKVLLLGQDPYHDDGQAHGLCFSVKPGVPPPRSLINIYKEMEVDLGIPRARTGCLSPWAQQGVMLLNTVLSVRAHEAASHSKRGWEQFTDAVIKALNSRNTPLVFVLWGGHAEKKECMIDSSKHIVIKSAHPSPLSASRGFFGSKPFSKVNDALKKFGQEPLNWSLEAAASPQKASAASTYHQPELF